MEPKSDGGNGLVVQTGQQERNIAGTQPERPILNEEEQQMLAQAEAYICQILGLTPEQLDFKGMTPEIHHDKYSSSPRDIYRLRYGTPQGHHGMLECFHAARSLSTGKPGFVEVRVTNFTPLSGDGRVFMQEVYPLVGPDSTKIFAKVVDEKGNILGPDRLRVSPGAVSVYGRINSDELKKMTEDQRRQFIISNARDAVFGRNGYTIHEENIMAQPAALPAVTSPVAEPA